MTIDEVINLYVAQQLTPRSRQIREAINAIYDMGREPAVVIDYQNWIIHDIHNKFPYPNTPATTWRLGLGSIANYSFDDDVLRFSCSLDRKRCDVAIPTLFIDNVIVYGGFEVHTPPASIVDMHVFLKKYAGANFDEIINKGKNPEVPERKRPTLTVVK